MVGLGDGDDTEVSIWTQKPLRVPGARAAGPKPFLQQWSAQCSFVALSWLPTAALGPRRTSTDTRGSVVCLQNQLGRGARVAGRDSHSLAFTKV